MAGGPFTVLRGSRPPLRSRRSRKIAAPAGRIASHTGLRPLPLSGSATLRRLENAKHDLRSVNARLGSSAMPSRSLRLARYVLYNPSEALSALNGVGFDLRHSFSVPSRHTPLRRSNRPTQHVGGEVRRAAISRRTCCPPGTAQPLGKTERPLFRCRAAAAGGGCGGGCGGGVAAPHVAAVLTSRPSIVTTVAASFPSILTTLHPDGLCFGV